MAVHAWHTAKEWYISFVLCGIFRQESADNGLVLSARTPNAKAFFKTRVAEYAQGEVFMENEAFIEEIKVGFGVVVLGFLRAFFKRFIRGLAILENKLHCALKKRLHADAAA